MTTAPDTTPAPFAAVVETVSGVVFFVGDRAYKLKKPVSLGFLDFRDRVTRHVICQREVELNSRLAPDVYLGVADVIGPDGSVCDHLIMMRRLPDDRRLAHLINTGAPVEELIRQVASVLAAFHARAERSSDIDVAASHDAVRARWDADSQALGRLVPAHVDPDLAARVTRLALRYLIGRAPLFESRIAATHICDGHGDLLADDIFCLPDGPRILDCLEFDDRLRQGDVLGDIAFLVMDLERLGRPDLARVFVDHYRRVSGERWPSSLEHYYCAQRAQVRALVAGLRASKGDAQADASCRRLLDLAASHLAAGRVRLVVVGGLPGTGKSTLATEVGSALGARVLRSDEVRKRLAGVAPTQGLPAPFGQGIYAPSMTAATYRAMLDEARSVLPMGESVVLDATFVDPAWRTAACAVASETVADLIELHCVAPQGLARSRVARRRRRGGDASDATYSVMRELARREAAWPTAADVDTGAPSDALRLEVRELLGVAGCVAAPLSPSGS